MMKKSESMVELKKSFGMIKLSKSVDMLSVTKFSGVECYLSGFSGNLEVLYNGTYDEVVILSESNLVIYGEVYFECGQMVMEEVSYTHGFSSWEKEDSEMTEMMCLMGMGGSGFNKFVGTSDMDWSKISWEMDEDSEEKKVMCFMSSFSLEMYEEPDDMDWKELDFNSKEHVWKGYELNDESKKDWEIICGEKDFWDSGKDKLKASSSFGMHLLKWGSVYNWSSFYFVKSCKEKKGSSHTHFKFACFNKNSLKLLPISFVGSGYSFLKSEGMISALNCKPVVTGFRYCNFSKLPFVIKKKAKANL